MVALGAAAGCSREAAPTPPAPSASAAWKKAPEVETQVVATSTAATVRRTREMMTTYVTVVLAAPESAAAEAAIEASFAEVARLETLLSEWKPDTEISRVNARAGGSPVVIGEELMFVLSEAKRVAVATEGAFDVTFAALGGLWDFRWQTPKVPTPEQLGERLLLIDHRRLVLDAPRSTAVLLTKGMKVGLGGIAKGYIVDRMSHVLRRHGFPDHLVSAGGDMYAGGQKGGEKWRVGIRDPLSQTRGVLATVELSDEAISTSGNYERYFMKDGQRYHHILDPKTGMPARDMASVTVIAKTGVIADGFDTGLFIVGARRGLEIAAREGFDVLFVDEALRPTMSPGMAPRLRWEPK